MCANGLLGGAIRVDTWGQVLRFPKDRKTCGGLGEREEIFERELISLALRLLLEEICGPFRKCETKELL